MSISRQVRSNRTCLFLCPFRNCKAVPIVTRCPMCLEAKATFFHEDKRRTYLRCGNCRLTFVTAEYHLDLVAEKAEYDLHQNSPLDQGYRKFLARLLDPVNAQLAPNSHGLDFGSGPGPTLSVMFEEAGHSMAIYDPFYSPDETPLQQTFDFVTASEVIEHFRNPAEDLERMWSCVRPGGLLGIMTKLALGRSAFADWHYKNDRTHVCFFSYETLKWLATKWGATLTLVGDDVAIFVRNARMAPSIE